MKHKLNFRSEDGAAYVLEATIVYPIVLISVIFLIMVGFTYAQKSLLQHRANELSSYLVKVIRYPGYNKIEPPFYVNDGKVDTSLEAVNGAMEQIDPYRYIMGIFGQQYDDTKQAGVTIVKGCSEETVEYLAEHSYLKAADDAPEPTTDNYKGADPSKLQGRSCYISATTSRVAVYLGQYYVFSNMFRMIGIGGTRMTITGESVSYVCDTVEIARVTDMAFDVVSFISGKLGFDTEKITSAIQKLTNNSGK